MPRVLCCTCGATATCLVRLDYNVRRGGMSLCDRCTPSKGVWVLRYDNGELGETISGTAMERVKIVAKTRHTTAGGVAGKKLVKKSR